MMIDVNDHPLLRQCYELGLAIEEIPAGAQQTRASELCSELLESIHAEVQIQCEALTQPKWYKKEDRCPFRAKHTLPDGKRVCGQHAKQLKVWRVGRIS